MGSYYALSVDEPVSTSVPDTRVLKVDTSSAVRRSATDEPVSRNRVDPMVGHGLSINAGYSTALPSSSMIFLASPKTIIVLSM